MRRPTRQFTVEIRSSNRRSPLKPASIWGDIDLKTLTREAEAEISTDWSPIPSPVDPVGETVRDEQMAASFPAQSNQFPEQNQARPDVSSAGVGNNIDVPLPVQVVPVAEKTTKHLARPRKTKPRRVPARKSEALPTVAAVEQTEVDWLLAENFRLKLLLRQKLLQDNALLRDMLNRN